MKPFLTRHRLAAEDLRDLVLIALFMGALVSAIFAGA